MITQKALTQLRQPGFGYRVRLRLSIIFVVCLCFFFFVIFRLVQLQVLSNPALTELSEKQFHRTLKIAPPRLSILDRSGEELALSIPANSLFVRPKLVRNRRHTARVLAGVLGGTSEKWYRRLRVDKPFVWIQRQVTDEIVKQVARHKLYGIFVEKENKRMYPHGSLAAQLIGFTDIDGNGLSGLELSLNDELLKKPSQFAMNRDGKGNPSYFDQSYLGSNEGSRGVYTTLDRRIQNIIEEESERAMIDTGAEFVFAMVVDPFTGDILGMGQRPTFDPNRPAFFSEQLFSNRFVSYLFEPGSTMKVILGATALDKGLITQKTLIDCENGKLLVGNKWISEADKHHHYSLIPFEKVIRVSSNIGAVKVARMLAKQGIIDALETFSLSKKSLVNLPGEVFSPIKDAKQWDPMLVATAGFGQGVSVSPLQMVYAFAPFANGGYLPKPRILLREGTAQTSNNRVVSPATSEIMKQILVSVVHSEDGTGSAAKIANIKVAGKTGTAQKYDAVSGYQGKKYYSSFIGFLPADEPRLLVGVMIDEPKNQYYASQVAAPVFKRIAERSLQVLNHIPKHAIHQNDSVNALSSSQITIQNKPVDVVRTGETTWMMPDLRGLGIRQIFHEFGKNFSNLRLLGHGYVREQTPVPGSMISKNTSITLQLVPAG